MRLDELTDLYRLHPQLQALNRLLLSDERTVRLNGIQGSSVPVLFSTLMKHFNSAQDVPSTHFISVTPFFLRHACK